MARIPRAVPVDEWRIGTSPHGHARRARPWGSSNGSILILAFWVLSFLSVLAITMGSVVRQKLTLMDRLNLRSQLYWAAEAGEKRGEEELTRLRKDVSTDSVKDGWAQAESLFKNTKVGDGIFSLKITDEESKINLNTAGLDVMVRLFKEVLGWRDAQAEELASAIIDWRDPDNSPLSMGAENAYYTGLEYPYECKNARFDIPDELLLVRGVTATIYNIIKDYVTIYGSGVVNINTAPRPVLLALGLDAKVADKILAFRAGDDKEAGPEGTKVFMSAPAVLSQLSQSATLGPDEVTNLSQVASSGLIGVASANFSVESLAHYESKKGSVSITCVLERVALEGGGYAAKVKYWRVGG